MADLLNPKIDFVFKNIFGSPNHPEILISFLNAVLKPKNPITEVSLQNTDIHKEYLEDKYAYLDIKATTNNRETINIEIQLKNESNMINRTLYYLSRLYAESLKEGQNYDTLTRTVCINILDFNYLPTTAFHSTYRFGETTTHQELTDIMEIHFIELPKLADDSEEKDLLVAWLHFLKNPGSEKVRDLEKNVAAIGRAKDELIKMSNNEEERLLYHRRLKYLSDAVSNMEGHYHKGLAEGREEGREKALLQVAISLLDILDDQTIATKTGLSLSSIQHLRKNKTDGVKENAIK